VIHHENAVGLAADPLGGADASRVEVSEVHAAAPVLRNAGGQRDADARRLDAALVRAEARDVGRMGQDGPRHVGEAVHLRQEIVEAMVSDAINMMAMCI